MIVGKLVIAPVFDIERFVDEFEVKVPVKFIAPFKVTTAEFASRVPFQENSPFILIEFPAFKSKVPPIVASSPTTIMLPLKSSVPPLICRLLLTFRSAPLKVYVPFVIVRFWAIVMLLAVNEQMEFLDRTRLRRFLSVPGRPVIVPAF